jgi:hypothetical protein
MGHHVKKVSELKDAQITVDPKSTWAKLPVIGVVLAVVGFAVGFGLPAPGGAFAEDADLWAGKLWTSYVTGFMFALALGLGGLIFTLIQHLVRANWSVVVRRIAENVMFTLPITALAGIPILVWGDHAAYSWTHVEHVMHDPMLKAKVAYLNESSATLRYVIYVALWSLMAFSMWSWSRKSDVAKTQEEADELARKARWWAPIGVLVFALSMTFGAFDFLMSIDPHWFSTMFGVYYFAGLSVCFYSLMVIVVFLLQRGGMLEGVVTPEHYHDLGKFMFGFTVFWTYIGFSQYFLIWYANIPEETNWFMYRAHGEWYVLSLCIVFGRFVLPFFLLLRRGWKRDPNYLVKMALLIVTMEFVDMFWLTQPGFAHHAAHAAELAGAHAVAEYFHHHIPFTGNDVGFLAGFLGLFLATFGWSLKTAKLVPIKDPRLEDSLNHENF